MEETVSPAEFADAPAWFREALAMEPRSERTTAEGCAIHFLRWGPERADKAGLIFLHAGGAHAYWWAFIAPFFAKDRPVAAIDFSGMGDSGRRAAYGSDSHVEEIAAVIRAAGLGPKPVVVGHSFGGFMAMCHGHRYGADLGGVVFAETPIKSPAERAAHPVEAYTRPLKVYPDRATILSRFRFGAEARHRNGFIQDFVAERSVAPADGGWTWKFDVAARGAAHHDEPLADYVAGLACRKALIYGEASDLAAPATLAYMTGLFAPGDPIVGLPGAGHHLFVDEPIAFVAALRAILSGWAV